RLAEGAGGRSRRQSSCGRRGRTCRGRSLPAGLAQPAGEHLHHAHGDLRALAEDVAKVVAADLQQDGILDGGDAGRAGLRIEHRHLPEHVALAEPHELLAPLVHFHLSFDDQVERVARLALGEDLVAGRQRLLLRDLGNLRQLLGWQGTEEVDALEEQHLLHGGDHALALGADRSSSARTVRLTDGAGSPASGASSREASAGAARATARAAASRRGADAAYRPASSAGSRRARGTGPSSAQRAAHAATQGPHSPPISAETSSATGRASGGTWSPRRFVSSRFAIT